MPDPLAPAFTMVMLSGRVGVACSEDELAVFGVLALRFRHRRPFRGLESASGASCLGRRPRTVGPRPLSRPEPEGKQSSGDRLRDCCSDDGTVLSLSGVWSVKRLRFGCVSVAHPEVDSSEVASTT